MNGWSTAATARDQIAQHLGQRVRIGARLFLRGLRAADLRRGDLLHRLGDLLRVLQRPNPVAKISYAYGMSRSSC